MPWRSTRRRVVVLLALALIGAGSAEGEPARDGRLRLAQAAPAPPASAGAAAAEPSLDELQAKATRLRDELSTLLEELAARDANAPSVGRAPAAAPTVAPAPAPTRPRAVKRRDDDLGGAPAAAAEPPPAAWRTRQPAIVVEFEPGESVPTEAGDQELRDQARTLTLFSVRRILVVGFGDRRGSREAREELARDRAAEVARRLAGLGVAQEGREVATGREAGLPDRPQARSGQVQVYVLDGPTAAGEAGAATGPTLY